MKFRDIKIGQRFTFAPSGFVDGTEKGPFTKRSPRGYDWHRRDGDQVVTYSSSVGTIDVEILPETD